MKQASLDSQGGDDCEIVPIELPNPKETQIWEVKTNRDLPASFAASARYYRLYLTNKD